MKKFSYLLLLVALPLLFTACSSYKKVPYLQASEYLDTSKSRPELYDAKIMPKDLLTIIVSCNEEPELAKPFNLVVVPSPTSLTFNMNSQPAMQNYLVDNNGEINFPVLGSVYVGGLTKGEAEQMLYLKIRPYIRANFIVTVRMTNYKISVLGEVNRPGTFTIANEKVNVLEALAMAGDMSIYGRRDNVKLIREDAQGKQRIIMLNMNDARLVLSPYYNLQQNDIIYVTPNKSKAKSSGIGADTNLWFSTTSILVSIASLLYMILK